MRKRIQLKPQEQKGDSRHERDTWKITILRFLESES